jgi:hypothetical protein
MILQLSQRYGMGGWCVNLRSVMTHGVTNQFTIEAHAVESTTLARFIERFLVFP